MHFLECCCRSKKPTVQEDTTEANLTSEINTTIQISSSDPVQPPNYDEIDPPPAYAILFPNQKSVAATEPSSPIAALEESFASVTVLPQNVRENITTTSPMTD